MEGFVLWGRPEEEGVGVLQVFRLFTWLLLEQWPLPGLCQGLEALGVVHILLLMSMRAFSSPETSGPGF